MNLISIIIGFIVGAIIALAVYIILQKSALKGKSEEIIKSAEIEGEKIKNEKILQAKEKFLSLKSEHDKYVNEKNAQIREAESRVKQKENTANQITAELQKKNKDLENIKLSLKGQQEALSKKSEEYDKLRSEVNKQLENIAGMTAQEAKTQLVEAMKAYQSKEKSNQ